MKTSKKPFVFQRDLKPQSRKQLIKDSDIESYVNANEGLNTKCHVGVYHRNILLTY